MVNCQRERAREKNRFLALRQLVEKIEALQGGGKTKEDKASEKKRKQKARRKRRSGSANKMDIRSADIPSLSAHALPFQNHHLWLLCWFVSHALLCTLLRFRSHALRCTVTPPRRTPRIPKRMQTLQAICLRTQQRTELSRQMQAQREVARAMSVKGTDLKRIICNYTRKRKSRRPSSLGLPTAVNPVNKAQGGPQLIEEASSM